MPSRKHAAFVGFSVNSILCYFVILTSSKLIFIKTIACKLVIKPFHTDYRYAKCRYALMNPFIVHVLLPQLPRHHCAAWRAVPAPYVDVENGRKVWFLLVLPSQLLLIRNKASIPVRDATCRAVACFIPKPAGKGHHRKKSFFFLVAKQYV